MKPILFVLVAVWSAGSMAQTNCACSQNTLWDPYESDPIPQRETVSHISAPESPTVMLLSMLGAHDQLPVQVKPDPVDSTVLEFGAFHAEWFDRLGVHVWLNANDAYNRIARFDTLVFKYSDTSTRVDHCLDYETGERVYVERRWGGFLVGAFWWYDDAGNVSRLLEVDGQGKVTHEWQTLLCSSNWWGPSEKEIQLGFRYADAPFSEMKYASWWRR